MVQKIGTPFEPTGDRDFVKVQVSHVWIQPGRIDNLLSIQFAPTTGFLKFCFPITAGRMLSDNISQMEIEWDNPPNLSQIVHSYC
jgi:hypothetical protein